MSRAVIEMIPQLQVNFCNMHVKRSISILFGCLVCNGASLSKSVLFCRSVLCTVLL